MYSASCVFISLILCTLLLYNCSIKEGPDSPAGHDTSIASLRTRIDRLWTARINQEWTTVFDLYDLTYTELLNREEFRKRGEFHDVQEYEITDIVFDDPENARASIKFKIQKHLILFNPIVTELWVFEKDRGWVLNKTAMTTRKPF